MLKLVGSVFVLAGGVLAQTIRLAERRRQWDTLSALLSALRQMAEEIRLTRRPMLPLLEGLQKDCGGAVSAFFGTVGEGLRRREPLPDAWRRACECLELPIDGGETLAALGASLGGDEEQTCKAITLVIYTLEKDAGERAAERRAEDRRAAALCFSASALLVLLLI